MEKRKLQVEGFSLIELAAVLAVVAALGLAFTPALARTQPNSKAIQCQNNLRRFSGGWTMYAADNLDRLVNNFGVNETTQEINQKTYRNWANNVMDWTTNQGNTNRDLLRAGIMSPYLKEDLDVYRCPADAFLSPPQLAQKWTGRTRSISMNSILGRFSAGIDSTAQGVNWALPQYSQHLRLGAIPKPDRTWVVIDEHPDSINDGYFINNPAASNWQDIPASYHNGGCGFSFTDGHCEIRRWLSAASRYGVQYSYPSTKVFDPNGRVDYSWYLQRTGYVDARTGKPAFGY